MMTSVKWFVWVSIAIQFSTTSSRPTCTKGSYHAKFVDGCVECPEDISICDQEHPSDIESCRQSCRRGYVSSTTNDVSASLLHMTPVLQKGFVSSTTNDVSAFLLHATPVLEKGYVSSTTNDVSAFLLHATPVLEKGYVSSTTNDVSASLLHMTPALEKVFISTGQIIPPTHHVSSSIPPPSSVVNTALATMTTKTRGTTTMSSRIIQMPTMGQDNRKKKTGYRRKFIGVMVKDQFLVVVGVAVVGILVIFCSVASWKRWEIRKCAGYILVFNEDETQLHTVTAEERKRNKTRQSEDMPMQLVNE